MDDLFSNDKYAETWDKDDKHSLLGSIAMLIILSALVVMVLIPSLPKEISLDTPIQVDATIERLSKYDGKYVATVAVDSSEATQYYSVELTKKEFIEYKEKDPVRIEIKGNNCKIIN